MGHGDLPGFVRMLKLVVVPLHVMENPAILFEPTDQVTAVYDVYDTHSGRDCPRSHETPGSICAPASVER